jgi:hypothetical protein
MRRPFFCALAMVLIATATRAAPPARTAARHWEVAPGSPPCVTDFVAALPGIKAQAIAGIQAEIDRIKHERACVVRAPLQSTDATGTPTLTGGSISRTDGSEEVRQRLQIKAYDDEVVTLYARMKAVVTDPLWLPDGAGPPPRQWEIGALGALPTARVVQVIDGQNVVADADGSTVWLTAIDTSRMVDGEQVTFVKPQMWVRGNQRWTAPSGEVRTVFLVQPFDLRAHLVAVDDRPAPVLRPRPTPH